MWMLRRRDRFSLEELRYLTEQLQRTSYVNESNKESIVEILRSIAELMIWGDQHDPSFFEYFMEKQVMLLFLHILKVSSGTAAVAVQLLQSIGMMIQNIHTEHAIYYIFSNGYLNHFITYRFDFQHEELLAYYISFLRTISTKLDRTTISFFIRTENDEVVSFPLYTEAIRFFRHEESMVRIAVRTLTLNVYHVDDPMVRKFVTSEKVVGYITDLVNFLTEKCREVEQLVADVERTIESESSLARLEGGVAGTEEILDYCNDIICAGIPDLSEVMTEDLVNLFVLPEFSSFASGNALPALHSLTRALHIIKHKPLANGIAAATLCETPMVGRADAKGQGLENGLRSTSSVREILLSHIVSTNENLALASVSFFIAILRNEVDDSFLDLVGVLPRLKQHKRKLLHALMGSNSDEELLFPDFSASNTVDGGNIKVENKKNDVCTSSVRTQEVVEKLVELLCRRPPACSEALCRAGSLLWQIFPDQQDDLQTRRLQKIREADILAKEDLLAELDDCWCDAIPSVISEEWKACKKALEGSHALVLDAMFFVKRSPLCADDLSSFSVAERMQNRVKVFVLLHQVQQLLVEGCTREFPLLDWSSGPAKTTETGVLVKVGNEVELDNALPCRIAFERGKERAVYLLPMTRGTSGWLLLAEDMNSSKPGCGIIRVIAPLSGCMPEIDQEHPRWLHLRIRPPTLTPTSKKIFAGPPKVRRVDGRWTLAFGDAETCKRARDFVLSELRRQKEAVLSVLQPLLRDLGAA